MFPLISPFFVKKTNRKTAKKLLKDQETMHTREQKLSKLYAYVAFLFQESRKKQNPDNITRKPRNFSATLAEP